MLYALLTLGASTIAASIYVAFLHLKIKSTNASKDQAVAASTQAHEAYAALVAHDADAAKLWTEQISSLDQEIKTLKGQRDEALTQLAKSGTPGSMADLLRARTGVPDPGTK